MEKYIEMIKDQFKIGNNNYTLTRINTQNNDVEINKTKINGSENMLKYFFYTDVLTQSFYNYIDVLSYLTKLQFSKIKIIESEDPEFVNEFTTAQNVNGDVIKIRTVKLEKALEVIIEGRELENNEKYYDNLIITALEQTLEQSLRQGRSR